MSRSTIRRAGLLAVLCVGLSLGVGFATSVASSKGYTATLPARSATARTPWGGLASHGLPVHGGEIVLDKAAASYISETLDRGTVSSVEGDQLAVTEGTKAVPYKTVTLSIPSNATVLRNGASAALADLKVGDPVLVRQSSDRTVVLSGDAATHGRFGGRWGGNGRPPFGPYGFGG